MKIINKLLDVHPFSRPGPKYKIKKVKAIVIHYVENPNITANGIYYYFNKLGRPGGEKRKASSHYVVGKKGEVLRLIPETEQAWHVGALRYKIKAVRKLGYRPNAYSLGIETCHYNWQGKMHKQTWDSLVALSAALLNKYKLDAEKDLLLHWHVTGKRCHRWFVDNPDDWAKFIEDVKKKINLD